MAIHPHVIIYPMCIAEITILAGSSCPSLRVASSIGKSRCVSNCLVAGGEGSIGTAEGLLRVSRRNHMGKTWKNHGKSWKTFHIPFRSSWSEKSSGTWVINNPIGSMYRIYANIGGILMVNVTIYSIHGSYGNCQPH